MARGTRISPAGVLVIALMACGGSARAEDAGSPHTTRRLSVAVYDYAGADAATLKSAQRVAGEAYRNVGVEIEWVDAGRHDGETTLYVNLVTDDMRSPSPISNEAVGYATPGSLAANAIYDRIRTVARKRHVPVDAMLGYVIAHELGHLLLPAPSHSPSGLMRATLDLKLTARRKLQFTSDQAAQIRERLTASRAVSTH